MGLLRRVLMLCLLGAFALGPVVSAHAAQAEPMLVHGADMAACEDCGVGDMQAASDCATPCFLSVFVLPTASWAVPIGAALPPASELASDPPSLSPAPDLHPPKFS